MKTHGVKIVSGELMFELAISYSVLCSTHNIWYLKYNDVLKPKGD